ncbi:MAG: DUF2721 domain-containing protein [Limisphaerales bacterium]
MSPTTLHEIIPVLQVATGPVILISGIGLLLLTMTNRLGRTIDRARQLCRELPEAGGEKRTQTLTQIAIIYRRAQVIRWSIGLAGFSVLLVATLIIILFIGALLDWQAESSSCWCSSRAWFHCLRHSWRFSTTSTWRCMPCAWN